MIQTIKVFGGGSNTKLSESICSYLGVHLGAAKIETFPDGEKMIKLEDDVRGKDCFVIQSTAVIPYFGYARQDRKDEGRVPITAKLVANLITTAGADRVLSIDLHAAQLQGFFDIPVDHLTAEPVLTRYFKDRKISDLTVVAPDAGNMKTASRYAAVLGGELAIIHKRRVNGSEVESNEIIGQVEGRNIVMCDDIISTAGTLCEAAKLLEKRGAKKVIAGATHGVLAGKAVERLNEAPFDEVIVTDTIPVTDGSRKIRNLKVLTVAELFGEAIKRIHRDESISSMFE